MRRKDRIKKAILVAAADAARDFCYYSRKKDESLSVGDIAEALEQGWITLDQIVAAFRADLVEWGALRDGSGEDASEAEGEE